MTGNSHKKLIYVGIFIHFCFIEYSNEYFHLYKTTTTATVENQFVHGYDCFYALIRPSFMLELILQPYCLRPDNRDLKETKPVNKTEILGTAYTFFQLRQLNVASKDLYEWSAPIDIIEHYELYLFNSSAPNEIYYNCTSPFWFGSFCQYTLNSLDSFTDIIQERFQSRVELNTHKAYKAMWNITYGTCYMSLKCNRGPFPMCLDWSEICNRKCDCLNDCVDEEECFQLEINECTQDQYRCSNGMCIPQEFFRDRNLYADCMDASDETIDSKDIFLGDCFNGPAFDCNTLTSNWFNHFSCGNGIYVQYSPLTLSTECPNGRDLLQNRAILSYDISSGFSEQCWLAIICAFDLNSIFDIKCNNIPSIETECLPSFVFPSPLSSFNNIHFIYERNRSIDFLPNYICYNARTCDTFLEGSVFINGWACKTPMDLLSYNVEISTTFKFLYRNVQSFLEMWCPLPYFAAKKHGTCSHSTLFYCQGTPKCISKYRLQDGNIDCYQSYDELSNESCSLNLPHRFYCTLDRKCIPSVQLTDDNIDCSEGEDELISNRDCVLYKQCEKEKIIFSKICDGFTETMPIIIDDQNETDETDCQYWPCDTLYTHCDKVWNCRNGADELNCSYEMYSYECKTNEHHCLQFSNITEKYYYTKEIIHSCLSLKFIADEQVDCLGATDERSYCREMYPNEPNKRYRCWNDTQCIDTKYLCDCQAHCPSNDDEEICPWLLSDLNFCITDFFTCRDDEPLARQPLCLLSQCAEKEDALICDLSEWKKPERKYFSIGAYFLQYPSILMKNEKHQLISTEYLKKKSNDLWLQWYCNQGVLVYSSDKNSHCFCPPAYYGDRCQYQNELIGFILVIRRKSLHDYLHVFRAIILLLDGKNNTLFQEQILYISLCETRYHMYLLYPYRPKPKDHNYSVRLDIYAIHRLHNTIQFRSSFFYSIPFTFLPVNRLVVSVSIPEKQAEEKSCEKNFCQNGKCYRYENLNEYFCRCDHGWSGQFCHLRHECHCSPSSICTETGCICLLGKSGSSCYFPEEISCQEIICQHNGACIPHDQRILGKDSVCMCTEEYQGQFCESHRRRMTIAFDSVSIPASIFIHFFISRISRNPDRLTQFKRISIYENIAVLYSSMEYNLAFAQFDDNYYLVFLNSTPTRVDISITVIQSNQCLFIEKLLDRKIFLFHPLKRIKYYQLICQNNLDLLCFYDETQLCLCTKNHMTTCFDFLHNETSTCLENNYCQNNGQCYINDLKCPTKFLCVCPQCYHGTVCQFTTSGSVLSLDSIIGYHIQPNIPFVKQPFIIKLETGITIGMFAVGSISNIFSIITFSQKKTLTVGCGFYLLSSSILSIVTMILFGYKYWSLLVIQMALITNERFLDINCKLIDFLLRFLPTSIDWLNVCVAIERVVNIIMNVHFNKRKSIFWAKVTIILVVLVNILSTIHDPINRRLLEDTEEQRIWCIVSYTHLSWLNTYNKTLNIIHFIVPFGINFISAFIIIIHTARQRSVTRKNQTYREHLKGQFRQHKHLLISSSALVILTSPRLIISFFSGCMKSARDPWLFLSAYWISFIPPVLTFPIFIIPSDTYRTEFIVALKSFQTIIRRFFNRE